MWFLESMQKSEGMMNHSHPWPKQCNHYILATGTECLWWAAQMRTANLGLYSTCLLFDYVTII